VAVDHCLPEWEYSAQPRNRFWLWKYGEISFLVLHRRLLVSCPLPRHLSFLSFQQSDIEYGRPHSKPCCELTPWTHTTKSLWLLPTLNSNPTTSLLLLPYGALPVSLLVSPRDASIRHLPLPHPSQTHVLLTVNFRSTNQAQLVLPAQTQTNLCLINRTLSGHHGHPTVGSSIAPIWPRNVLISRVVPNPRFLLLSARPGGMLPQMSSCTSRC